MLFMNNYSILLKLFKIFVTVGTAVPLGVTCVVTGHGTRDMGNGTRDTGHGHVTSRPISDSTSRLDPFRLSRFRDRISTPRYCDPYF